jgi:hypothetical protein
LVFSLRRKISVFEAMKRAEPSSPQAALPVWLGLGFMSGKFYGTDPK